MNILVDENIPFARQTFGCHGELIRYSGRSLQPQDLIGVRALITRSVTKVDQHLLSRACPDFVGTCTIGTDHFDTPFLESSNIRWACAPGCNAQSVVDYVLAVVVALKGEKLPQRVGIVGCGHVGGLLRKTMLGLGLDVCVYDPFLSPEEVPELNTLDQVFQSELVCLHTPYTEDTAFPSAQMIGAAQLDQLPENALLISAGRGGVIRETELKQVLKRRPDIRLALDVWQSEPCIDEELLKRAEIATPHIAGYSIEGKCRGTMQIYSAFCAHFGFGFSEPNLLAEAQLDKSRLDLVKAGQSLEFSDYVLAAYNPQGDTQRMKQAYDSASKESLSTGQWFDLLRREYPERREFASFCLPSGSVSISLDESLKRFGFRLR